MAYVRSRLTSCARFRAHASHACLCAVNSLTAWWQATASTTMQILHTGVLLAAQLWPAVQPLLANQPSLLRRNNELDPSPATDAVDTASAHHSHILTNQYPTTATRLVLRCQWLCRWPPCAVSPGQRSCHSAHGLLMVHAAAHSMMPMQN